MVRLLVIDDIYTIPQFAETRKMIMKHEFKNIELDLAGSNEGALEKLQTGSYDIIVYDIGMDEDVDYPILRKIRELSPGGILIGSSGAGRKNSELPNGLVNETHNSKGWIDLQNLFGEGGLEELLKKYGLYQEQNTNEPESTRASE